METRKLYYEDCRLARFTATVVSCTESKKGFLIELDQTAFYPEGGGQAADKGTLKGIPVLHVQEEGERVLHLLASPLTPGEVVEGLVDYDSRFDLMQQHTGEHILSGLIHARWGWHNTGFHMGADTVTVDFDGPIPQEAVAELEQLCNQAIYQNLALKIWTPSPQELPQVFYRTKRPLPWPVRIVQVPGYDSCACCGIHVERTGEIGLVKLLSMVKFRNGVRFEMLCGRKALAYLTRSHEQNRLVSQAFSAKLFETGAAAQGMNDLLDQQKRRISALEDQIFADIAARCRDRGHVLLIRPGLDTVAVRRLADAVAATCGGIAAVFSGDDAKGYSYCLMQPGADLRAFNKNMVSVLHGRGGGKPNFQMGSVQCAREAICTFFDSFYVPE